VAEEMALNLMGQLVLLLAQSIQVLAAAEEHLLHKVLIQITEPQVVQVL
jgi:hypothetical protein